MSDLIERDKAIDAIRCHINDIDGDDDALDYIATNMLKDVPSAEVVSREDYEVMQFCFEQMKSLADKLAHNARPKGEWIVYEGGWKDLDYYPPKCKCNQCGYEEELYILNAKPTNFCPNCGSDNREREGE